MALIPLVFGLVLQLRAWLTWRPFWLDEQMIARNIRDRDFVGLATVLDHNQAAPIGWLWLERAVVEVAGTGERTLRFVPFLFAAGCLVLAWLAVRRLLGPVGSFVTVTLFAANDYMLRYAAEAKQYSGDVFWVLLMIVLARWALVASGPRRFVLWWSVAALASLFSMGAILAMPALALILVGTAWWRGRWRLAWRAGLPGVLWLIAFAPHYLLTMGPLRDNDKMEQFWARRGYAPADADQSVVVEWAIRRLEVLAGQPLGLDAASLGREWLLFAAMVFWSLAVLGMFVAHRVDVPAASAAQRAGATAVDQQGRLTEGSAAPVPLAAPTGLLFAAPVVSAFVLAVLWISPLYMRLAMWIMPGLFLAVGFAMHSAARLVARRGWGPTPWARWTGGLVGAATILTAAVVLAPLPVAAVRAPDPVLFEYRRAVRWLIAQHRPGDVVVGVHGGQHALGWYDPDVRLSPLIWVMAPGEEPCDPTELRRRLDGFRRALLYADMRDRPSAEAANALTTLLGVADGAAVATGDFGPRGFVLAVDLRRDGREPAGDADVDSGPARPGTTRPCLKIVE